MLAHAHSRWCQPNSSASDQFFGNVHEIPVAYSADAEDTWKFTEKRTGSSDGDVIVSLTWPPPELAHAGAVSLADVYIVIELSVVKLVEHHGPITSATGALKKKQHKKKKKKASDGHAGSGGSSSSSSDSDKDEDVVGGVAGSEFVELSCGYAQLCVKDFVLSPRTGKRALKAELRGGTPFAPTEMECGRDFQRRAGWQKFKQNVSGVNKSECEVEVTTLLGPDVLAMGPAELALQQAIDDCLGYGRQQRTTLGSLYGQQFDACMILPCNLLPMLTFFRNLIARAYGTDAVVDGADPAAANKDTLVQTQTAKKKAPDSDDSSDSSGSSSDDGAGPPPKPRSLSDPKLIRGMFTRLMDNPGILRRTMIKAWDIWKLRKPKKVDKVGADEFELLDHDGGGSVDATEFAKFFKGEDEATRLERAFDNVVIRVFPMLADEAVLHQAMLTAKDNTTAIVDMQRETALLLDALVAEGVLSKEFKAFGGSESMVRSDDGGEDGDARDEVPFSFADIKPYP